VKNGFVHINGKQTELPDSPRTQFYHTVTTTSPAAARFVQKYKSTEPWRAYKIESRRWDDPKVQNYLNRNEVQSYSQEESRDSTTVDVVGFVPSHAMSRLKMSPLANKINLNITLETANAMRKDKDVISVEKFN